MSLAVKLAREYHRDDVLLINLSGRGDKDIPQVADILAGRS